MQPPLYDGNMQRRQSGQYQHNSDPNNWAQGPSQASYYQPAAPQQPQQFSYSSPYGGGGYDPNYGQSFANMVGSDPVMNIAKAYGEQFATQSKQKLEKVISIERLKYYFDVDNGYVGKKLIKLVFPFAYRNWDVISGNQNEPARPRFDVNANDLYIPLMAIITYILIAGAILGVQDRFSPEQLGLLSSSLFAWLFAENLLVTLTKYIINMSQTMTVWDVLSYTGYKYVGMIVTLGVSAFGGSTFYYGSLAYTSVAAVYFLIRSVKSYVLDNTSYDEGRKRKYYLIFFIALTQPFIMWWLTRSVVFYRTPKQMFEDNPFDDHGRLKGGSV